MTFINSYELNYIMCYYTSVKVKDQVITLKELKADFKFNIPIAEGFNYSDFPIVRPSENGIVATNAHWEFIPFWVKSFEELKTSRFKYDTLNAKGESVLDSKMYGEAARKRRCLVPSSGFFEWRHVYPLNKKTGLPLKTPIKYPHYIFMPDKEYFYMAGIWQTWTDKTTGETIDTFAICTTEANELMAQVHNSKKRMPTILTEDLAEEWMFGNLDEARIKEISSNKIPFTELAAYPIHKDFRKSIDPTEHVTYEELPPLQL